MSTRTTFIREGEYAAEVDVEKVDLEGGWPPYLTLSDAEKLERVRRALRDGDLEEARKLARVFRLSPAA